MDRAGADEASPDAAPSAAERYAELLPPGEAPALARALREPSPPCVLAHPLRIGREELAAILEREGLRAEPVAWHARALRLSSGSRPGLLWPFRAGLYQIQEEASLLPVRLLDPRPGERVLDLCAAPGGKAAQIAEALGMRGTVVANDRSGRRLAAVREKQKRLGLVNLTATRADGRGLPLRAGPFERVLVDAPCSAEGTARGAGAFLRGPSGFRRHLAATQRALLERALELVRPGGRVVYSTCSLAPEENEAVVDALLRAGAARAVPLEVPGLAQAPGATAWGGEALHPGLRHALRLWPHRSGTGGFFAIALESLSHAPGTPSPPAEAALPEPDAATREAVLAHLAERFALPEEAFAGLRLVRKGAREIHVVARDHRPPAALPPVSAGLPFVKRGARFPKPTTAGALLLARAARRNVLELDAEQAAAYQRRAPFAPRPAQLAACDAGGFVLLRREGHALGAGLLRRGPEGPVVRAQFPRAWVPHAERPGAAGGEGEGASPRAPACGAPRGRPSP